MRLLGICPALLVSAICHAEDCAPKTLLESYADDGSVNASIPWQPKYNNAPSWNIDDKVDPPLSISAAVTKALEWARKRNNRKDIHVANIGIWSAGCKDKWDYVFHFVAEDANARLTADSALVLMDGTVLEKVPVKK